jgi:hypothetical protein
VPDIGGGVFGGEVLDCEGGEGELGGWLFDKTEGLVGDDLGEGD